MQVAKSLLYKIINQTETFNATLDMYNDTLSFIIQVIDKEFDRIKGLTKKSCCSGKTDSRNQFKPSAKI